MPARLLFRLLTFALVGLATTLGVAMLMTVLVDVQTGRVLESQAFIDEQQWTITRFDRAGAALIKSVRVRGLGWGPQQASGAPDTPTVGDQTSAWASRTSDSSPEWLTLEYAKAVVPRELHVYESCAPGALVRVTVFDSADNEIEAWSGVDPSSANTTGTTPVSKIPVNLKTLTNKVKIYLASDKVQGWNEIDAVGLVDDQGTLQWARRVRASSTYAAATVPPAGTGQPEALLPGWADVFRPTKAFEAGDVGREEQLIDARGWPFLALSSRTDLLNYGNAAAANSASSYTLTNGSLGPATGIPSGTIAFTTPSANATRAPIPIHPIWMGLVLNTIFYGVIWLALWSVLVIPRRFVREVARFRSGACICCGYDLGYDFIRGCPECGWRRDPDHTRAPATPSPRITELQPSNGHDLT